MTQWNQVDIERHASLFQDLDINQIELLKAVADYKKTASVTLQYIRQFENALSNLEADLRLSSLPAHEAHQTAAKLQSETQQLQPFLTRIRLYRELLGGAAKNIQERLSLGNLLALARTHAEQSTRQREMFEQGYRIFTLVAQGNDFKEGNINIHEISSQAERIETKFRRLEIPSIPELAKVIVQRQIEACCLAVKEIHIFLAAAGHSLQGEVGRIEDIRNHIMFIRTKPFSEILASLPEEGAKLCRNINEFGYKSNLLKEIEKIVLLLENLITAYECLRYSYLPHLAQITMEAGFRLHPRVIAGEAGRNYFQGLRGLLRRLKIVFAAANDRAPLNNQVLAQKIFVALSTCPYYYCVGYEDERRVTDFIDTIIKEFGKPYPYDDLFHLINNAIAAYGALIEQDFAQFTITRRPGRGETEAPPPDGKGEEEQLGQLLARIEARADHLRRLTPQG
ncbi:MAG: hypothetical protein HY789_08580 [Deltaproteobacteria bacterium]|nr:hypothetical protein [Deltaproteobacteria bacterium]